MRHKVKNLRDHQKEGTNITSQKLCYLPQQEAVRTCTLSKSWRYLGSTRPNFTMEEIDFRGSKQEFINVLERCLQLYRDHKIFPQEFVLSMSTPDADSVSFLDKWIPVLVRDSAVEEFGLSFGTQQHAHALFDLPSVVFESESLQYLYLKDCNLSRVNCLDKEILSVNLKLLWLSNVFITDEILEKDNM
ncbi:Putative F-box protein [Striga hermonthica]|uniref:F-box protein n=1 Tax=Striga hermonthica TaxID=68872 RepID=A0A9N7N4U3_STRHE|nr:Putative F-box protein [Striga hermonthica]